MRGGAGGAVGGGPGTEEMGPVCPVMLGCIRSFHLMRSSPNLGSFPTVDLKALPETMFYFAFFPMSLL